MCPRDMHLLVFLVCVHFVSGSHIVVVMHAGGGLFVTLGDMMREHGPCDRDAG